MTTRQSNTSPSTQEAYTQELDDTTPDSEVPSEMPSENTNGTTTPDPFFDFYAHQYFHHHQQYFYDHPQHQQQYFYQPPLQHYAMIQHQPMLPGAGSDAGAAWYSPAVYHLPQGILPPGVPGYPPQQPSGDFSHQIASSGSGFQLGSIPGTQRPPSGPVIDDAEDGELKELINHAIHKQQNVYIRGLPASITDDGLYALCARYVPLSCRRRFYIFYSICR
jgi:hypothetical protein